MEASNFTVLDVVLVAVAILIAGIMLRRQVRDLPFWQATVTPLASIIGSGFLVVVPILASIAGSYALLVIIAIVLLSFWLGSSIRFNILHDGKSPSLTMDPVVEPFEHLSDTALAFAYVISVTFYIRLMCGFILTGLGGFTAYNANIFATGCLLFIAIYGFRRGLRGLERLEEYSVTIKLAIIGALLVGLTVYDFEQGYSFGSLSSPETHLLDSIREFAGLLLIVQGFETTKYLGSAYDGRTKRRSMWVAQLAAGAIYIAFVALSIPLMSSLSVESPSETAIIDLSANVTLVLPLMLVIAAAMSQFSAAIADTIGAGGVAETETRYRLTARQSYPILALLAIVLLWVADIFSLVALASRAFAFYYMLQAIVATRLAFKMNRGIKRLVFISSYALLSLVLLLIVIFAKPVSA